MEKKLQKLIDLNKQISDKKKGSKVIGHYIGNYIGAIHMLLEMEIEGLSSGMKKDELIKEYKRKYELLLLFDKKLDDDNFRKILENEYNKGNSETSFIDKLLKPYENNEKKVS